MVQPITEHHKVIRPTMKGEDTSGGKLTTIVMHQTGFNGDPDGTPPREDLKVDHPTKWAAHNNYVKGQTVYCNVAHFSGGNPDSTIYRYRLQKRADANADWLSYSWTSYTDHALEINTTCPEGQIRFHCQAKDSSVEPADQVDSMSTVETVVTPTLLPVDTTADGQPYNPSADTLEGVAGQSLLLVATPAAHGLLPLNYTWTVRSGSARLTPDRNSCVVVLQSTETELVSIQVDIVDSSLACDDTPQSIRFNIMTRPATATK